MASESQAKQQFNLFSGAIQPLIDAAAFKLLNSRDLLEQLADSLRPNPGWNCAHLAAKLGLVEFFAADVVAKLVCDCKITYWCILI